MLSQSHISPVIIILLLLFFFLTMPDQSVALLVAQTES